MSAWTNAKNLVLLGSVSVPRLPVFSFLVRHEQSGLFLHYNFVCTLLNDLFGIQARGGCACAGPYAQVSLTDPALVGDNKLLLKATSFKMQLILNCLN